ncbi:hypothetical protein K2173_002837 [Erythroxylum novogranatense]|uniref:Glycosyltransferase n=1 Tax=Erythroxylum novogranatense TaxID=1862640 RepID=A0AAV8SQ29_9ROSI|nr:hypothetical protein K2173_002837 [Erythroxylum novogranatense]
MRRNYEIWIVPFFGQGHVLPSIELAKHVASRKFKASLVIPTHLSSSIPSSLRHFPLLEVIEFPGNSSPPSPPPPQQPSSDLPLPPNHHHDRHGHMSQGLETLLSAISQQPNTRLPICALVDVMMSSTSEAFKRFEIPTIGFFTSGACSAAMEYAMWKAKVKELKPGEVCLFDGLPEDMALSDLDLKWRHRDHPGGGVPPPPPGGLIGAPPPPPGGLIGAPPPPPGGLMGAPPLGPPRQGDRPPWLEAAEGSIAFMYNTCDELESEFLRYIADQTAKPVWGVGPLLPDKYWVSTGSIVHDGEIRANRRSTMTEEEVNSWLDSKPKRSVLYVSFGSEVEPIMDEYPQLADALEATDMSFIWVIQSGSGRPGPPPHMLRGESEGEQGYFPHGLDKRVGERGLIIHGWAPQLLILSHPSTAAFLSHCGWNSAMEALGRGVPILAYPIRGDQYNNAQLIVNHLKVGCMISVTEDFIKKDDIVKGIERVVGDDEMKIRAAALSAKFENGFPESSTRSLDAFRDFINQKAETQ